MAEDELTRIFAGGTGAQAGADRIAAAWERITDQIGRERQIALYRASLGLAAVVLLQVLHKAGVTAAGFATWRPVLYAYLLWATALCRGQVLVRGERGREALFVLPAVLFTVSMVVLPAVFGLYVAFTDWNLSSFAGRQLNGLRNVETLIRDAYFWNALRNTVFYVLAVLVQFGIAFGLALLLNADIRARKFFRAAFLLPFMLSPVAVSWMIGKSLMEYRFGPLATLARQLGWDNPAFFASPWVARASVAELDAWVSIPFMMVLLLAGSRRCRARCSRRPRSMGPRRGSGSATSPSR